MYLSTLPYIRTCKTLYVKGQNKESLERDQEQYTDDIGEIWRTFRKKSHMNTHTSLYDTAGKKNIPPLYPQCIYLYYSTSLNGLDARKQGTSWMHTIKVWILSLHLAYLSFQLTVSRNLCPIKLKLSNSFWPQHHLT